MPYRLRATGKLRGCALMIERDGMLTKSSKCTSCLAVALSRTEEVPPLISIEFQGTSLAKDGCELYWRQV